MNSIRERACYQKAGYKKCGYCDTIYLQHL
jgi:hypothetical protein